MGGTGFEPVTPSLSILPTEQPTTAKTLENVMNKRFWVSVAGADMCPLVTER